MLAIQMNKRPADLKPKIPEVMPRGIKAIVPNIPPPVVRVVIVAKMLAPG